MYLQQLKVALKIVLLLDLLGKGEEVGESDEVGRVLETYGEAFYFRWI